MLDPDLYFKLSFDGVFKTPSVFVKTVLIFFGDRFEDMRIF